MAKKLVKNYVFTAGKGLNDNVVPLAYAKILANRTFLIKEINALIAYRVSTTTVQAILVTYTVWQSAKEILDM